MSMLPLEEMPAKDLSAEIAAIRGRIGKTLLDDRDLCLLACEAIDRSYTHEEKQYSS